MCWGRLPVIRGWGANSNSGLIGDYVKRLSTALMWTRLAYVFCDSFDRPACYKKSHLVCSTLGRQVIGKKALWYKLGVTKERKKVRSQTRASLPRVLSRHLTTCQHNGRVTKLDMTDRNIQDKEPPMVLFTWSPLLLYNWNRKVKSWPISYPSDKTHPLGHRNFSVRQNFIYSKTEGVINFESGQNSPTGVCTPNTVISTILSDDYFHRVALRIVQQSWVVNIQTTRHSV